MKGRLLKKYSTADIVFYTFNTIVMIFVCVVTLYPFLNTIAISFNDGIDTVRGGIYLWPRSFTLQNYKSVFSNKNLYNAALISVARTLVGTTLSVFCTAMLAYVLSRKDYIFGRFITMVFVFTMYVNGGLIPVYLLMKNLHLTNSFWVYIIPGIVSAFNMIVIRTYINGLPESLIESARIDGAGDLKIFISIVLPLIKPVLATVALFVAVGHWNSWFDSMLYNSAKQSLSTLQYELMKLLSSTTAQSNQYTGQYGEISNMVTPVSMRAAVTIVVSVPIIIVYPFLQKYFVTGLTIGGVKG